MSDNRLTAICYTVMFVAICATMVSCQWSLVEKAKIEAQQEPRP